MDVKDCAIVVMSCDSYSDLWAGFFSFKEKYWPDCPFECYLVSNRMICNQTKTILCGEELNWTGRLLYAINTIQERYVILMLEDYYISRTIDTKQVIDALRLIESENIAYYKLETRGTRFPTPYKGSSYLMRITPDIRYGVSLITSIWEKDFLFEVIGGQDYPAWEFEIRRNQIDDITRNTERLLLCDTRDILNITHMVQRGRFLRGSIRITKKNGDVINVGERGKVSVFFEPYSKLVTMIKNHPILRKALLKGTHIMGIKTISEKYEEEIKDGKYS